VNIKAYIDRVNWLREIPNEERARRHYLKKIIDAEVAVFAHRALGNISEQGGSRLQWELSELRKIIWMIDFDTNPNTR